MRPQRRRRSSRQTDAGTIETLIFQIHVAIPAAGAEAQRPESREFHFHGVRRWRFDLAFLSRQIAIEIEGGLFKGYNNTMLTIAQLAAARQVVTPADVRAIKMMGGRHNKAGGMKGDLEKYNEAAALGWIVLRVMPEMIIDGRALTWFEQVWNRRDVNRIERH